jgi:cytoskeletal protein RodZ
MFIAILVLLGLAGAIWYFARKQTQTVTLSQEDVAASDPLIKVAKETNDHLDKLSTRIEKTLTTAINEVIDDAVSEATTPEVKTEITTPQSPVVDPTPTVESPVAESVTPVVEAPKPAKKKRRYYPKKK